VWTKIFSCCASLLFALAAYVTISHLGGYSSNILVPLGTVLSGYGKWYSSGRLLEDVLSSLFRVLTGFTIGIVLAVAVASFLALRPRLFLLVNPILEFFRVVSPLAWIPFAILFFKIGNKPAIFLVTIAAFFPTYTATLSAIRNTSKSHIEVSLQFNASKWQQLLYLYFPSCLPEVFSGMRSSLGIAWYVLIAAEMLGAQSGLGYQIQMSSLSLQMEKVIASIGLIGLIGLIFGMTMQSVETYITRWKDKSDDIHCN